ncbi:hypothetical protein Tco_0803549 [Tanacetum coccineum]|uniref:Uncharacterized protein n=1 Tax=Tanacetum coccineum TaxID=301880 RepID=A0ABQ5A4C0_9ASTR
MVAQGTTNTRNEKVTPKTSHLNAVKRIFKYLKGKPNLGLWYPRESPFDLEAFSDSDYGGSNLDRKSTTGGCQFLGQRLISWQCKKQTIVATSTTEAEYVAAANCCGQVLWVQNQLLDYGFNFMNTKIHIDNESTICIVKNPVYHSKTKHIEIRHHFIRDCYEKKLISVEKIHTDLNVADLLTKPFDGPRFNYLVVSIGIAWMKGRSAKASMEKGGVLSSTISIASKPKYLIMVFPMAQLKYLYKHNPSGFLRKPNESVRFAEIVDYSSEFNTSENKHPYLAVSLTKKIFGNMKRDFQGAPRPLLPSMLLVATNPTAGQEHAAVAQSQPSSSTPQAQSQPPIPTPTPPPIPSPTPPPIPTPTPPPIPTPTPPPIPTPTPPPIPIGWMFDIDYLTDSMNYIPVSLENQANHAGISEETNSAGSSIASEEKDEEVEIIVVPSAVKTPEEKDASRTISKNSKPEETLNEPQTEMKDSSTNPKIQAFRRELEEIALKHLGNVPENNTTSTISLNTGSQTVNTDRLDHLMIIMPEL